ncbi:MAG: class I SAM-dependent methyltransferase [Chloroflexia bacterium]
MSGERTAEQEAHVPSAGDSYLDLPDNAALEARIEVAIEPWLKHMAWRADFAQWRDRRIRQEDHQTTNLQDVRSALRHDLADKVVLDLGAGMGGLSVALLRDFGTEGLRLLAMDYNPDYCRIARLRGDRYGIRLPIAVAAGEHLPYASSAFDLVICLDVLEHVAHAPSVLREMHRVLRPGGIVLTTVPNRHAFRDPHYHLPLINWLPRTLAEWIIERAGRSKVNALLHDRQGLSELNTYTWGQFERLAKSLGYNVQDQVYERIRHGEIRLLTGVRKRLLAVLSHTHLLRLLYRAYRYGWQGTFQITLVKG